MKKMNSKQVTLVTGTSLIIVAVIFGALIFSKLNTGEVAKDIVLSENQDDTPVVEEIEENEEVKQVVEVPKIQDTETKLTEDKNEVTVIDEPMPEPPEKPELEAPKDKPETNDDIENMDNVPEYKEEDLVVEPEEVVVVNELQESTEPEPVVEEESESNLVPSFENPFLNPENAAKPIESNGEDYYEDGRKAGEGDKF
jgi:type IV secretory pathway VirB10-like protein